MHASQIHVFCIFERHHCRPCLVMCCISILFLLLCLLHTHFINSVGVFCLFITYQALCWTWAIVTGKKVNCACFNEAYAVDLYITQISANSQLRYMFQKRDDDHLCERLQWEKWPVRDAKQDTYLEHICSDPQCPRFFQLRHFPLSLLFLFLTSQHLYEVP